MALVLVTGLLAPGTALPAAAQEISGQAVDAAGTPLPEVPVALHRVGGGSGATVDATTTDGDGRFTFAIQDPDSAVYFVAMRHDDRLYIGPPARGGAERVTAYELRADPANEAGAVASALSGGAAGAPAGTPGTMAPGATRPGGAGGGAAAWFVAVLALVVATVFVTTAPAYRRRRQREDLMEVAAIENRLGDADDGPDVAREERRRSALRERLGPGG